MTRQYMLIHVWYAGSYDTYHISSCIYCIHPYEIERAIENMLFSYNKLYKTVLTKYDVNIWINSCSQCGKWIDITGPGSQYCCSWCNNK